MDNPKRKDLFRVIINLVPSEYGKPYLIIIITPEKSIKIISSGYDNHLCVVDRYAYINGFVLVGYYNMKIRYGGKTRKQYYYDIAKTLKVGTEFVNSLFAQELEKGRTLDIGSRIRSKARLYKRPRKKPFNTKNIARNMTKIKTHRQECTANLTPLCLKVFVTNQEDTVCLRCQNYK